MTGILTSPQGIGILPLRTILDYDTRIDGNPVFVGRNSQAELTSATNWTIQQFFYDSLDRLVDSQVLIGVWDDRATLSWKPAGGN